MTTLAQCLMPTRQCFDDALDILVELLTVEQVPPTELRLVHAICLVPSSGTRFAHAWVEHQGQCLFLGLYQGERVLCGVPRAAYYATLRVQARTKYTPWQADRENARTLTYGPWHPQYQALCTPRKETGQIPRPEGRSLSLGMCPLARGLLSRGDFPRPWP